MSTHYPLLAILLTCSLYVTAQEKPHPEIVSYKAILQKVESKSGGSPVGAVYEAKLDIGLLRVEESRSAKLTFPNPLSADAKIINVRSSCACTDVKAINALTPPGKDFELSFILNANKKPGIYATTLEVQATSISGDVSDTFIIRMFGAVRDYIQFRPESSVTLEFEKGRMDRPLRSLNMYTFFEMASSDPTFKDPKNLLKVVSVAPVDEALPQHALQGWKITLGLTEKAQREFRENGSLNVPVAMQDTTTEFSHKNSNGNTRTELMHIWLSPKDFMRTRTRELKILKGTEFVYFDIFFTEPPVGEHVEFKYAKTGSPANINITKNTSLWWRVQVACGDYDSFLKGEALIVTVEDRGSIRIPISAMTN